MLRARILLSAVTMALFAVTTVISGCSSDAPVGISTSETISSSASAPLGGNGGPGSFGICTESGIATDGVVVDRNQSTHSVTIIQARLIGISGLTTVASYADVDAVTLASANAPGRPQGVPSEYDLAKHEVVVPPGGTVQILLVISAHGTAQANGEEIIYESGDHTYSQKFPLTLYVTPSTTKGC